MTTKEAIQAMLDAKKVRPVDENVAYFEHCYFDGVGFIDHNKDYFDFNYWVSKYTLWEIYEEPKPKKTIIIEKWLIIYNNVKIIVDVENIEGFLIEFGGKKIKLLDTYEVEL